jgi:hypothetical protein
MKLHYRFSDEPLLEVRTDYASADGRTVAGRPYLWFSSLENGVMRTRLKVIPQHSAEEACAFVEQFQASLLEISGTADAVEQIHQFFAGCGFDVRRNKGRAWHSVEPASEPAPEPEPVPAPAPESGVRQVLDKLAFWRKGAA